MLNKEGFDIEISQSNVTFVTKRPLVYDGESYKEVSFLRLYNVGFDKIEDPGRHGIGTYECQKMQKVYKIGKKMAKLERKTIFTK